MSARSSRPAAAQVSKNGRELVSRRPLHELFPFQHKSKPCVVLTARRPWGHFHRAAHAHRSGERLCRREGQLHGRPDGRPGGEQTPGRTCSASSSRGSRLCRWHLLLAKGGGASPGPSWADGRVLGPGSGSWQLSGSGRLGSEKPPWAPVGFFTHCAEAWHPSGAVS